MSKKNKMFRAWVHNYPDGGERSAFEFGWRNGKKEREKLQARIEALEADNSTLRDLLRRVMAGYDDPNAYIEVFKETQAALLEADK